jgi:hydrogenase expression/formation protein HypE
MAEVKRGYVRPLDMKHGRVDMAHGSGGRAMAQLIEELFARHLGNEYLARATTAPCCRATNGARPAGDGDRLPRGLAAVLSRRRYRLPVGAWHDQRRGGDGRQAAVSVGGLHPRRRLPAGRSGAHRAVHGRGGTEAGVPIVTGDTKVVERGKGDGVFITTTGVGVVAAGYGVVRAQAAAGRRHPGFRHAGRPRHGDHGGAREPGFRVAHRLRYGGAAWPDRGHAGHRRGIACAARSDARRAGDDAQRNRQQSGVGMMLQEKAIAGQASRSMRPANFSGWIRFMSPTKANWWRSAPKMMPKAIGRDARPSAGARRGHHRRVHEDAHHFVQMTTGFGGKRIVDWLSGDQLPRIC